jgi:ribosomal protein L11 methylase PrmA
MAGKRSNRLREISISISPEAEDAVVELLTELFSQPASIYADAEKKTTSASTYVSAFPPNKRAELRSRLQNIQNCGINIGSARISVRAIRREDWAESWKRHFKPSRSVRNFS